MLAKPCHQQAALAVVELFWKRSTWYRRRFQEGQELAV